MSRLNIGIDIASSANSVLYGSTAPLVAGGYIPDLAADFLNEYYRTETGNKTFLKTIEHSRNGNATMTGDYGPELVTNGDFSSSSTTGWANAYADTSFSVIDGDLVVVGTSASQAYGAEYEITTTSGAVYELEAHVDGTNASGGTGRLRVSSDTGFSTNVIDEATDEPRVYKLTFEATASSMFVGVSDTADAAGNKMILKHISVREIPKIQWAPHNLLTYSEDFSASDWTGAYTTRTQVELSNPLGLTYVSEVVDTTDNANHNTFATGQDGNSIVGVKYTVAMWAKARSQARTLNFQGFGNGANSPIFDLETGTMPATGSDWSDQSITDAGDGWYFITASTVATDTAKFQFGLRDGTTAAYAGTGSHGVYITGAHLYRSDLGGMADVPADERVIPTATKYVRTAGREVTGTEVYTASGQSGVIEHTDDPWFSIEDLGQVSISSDTLTFNNSSWETVRRDLLTAGKAYSVTFDVTRTSGTFKVYIGQGATTKSITASGTYTLSLEAGDTRLAFGGSSCVGTISNISVKEIDVDPSAARYLPRRGHHVYNGSQWVNKGLLHESEARTNLLTYSEDFTDASWNKAGGVSVTTSDTWFVNTSTGAGIYPKLVQTVSLGAGTYTFVYEVDTTNSTGTYCDIGISGTGIGGSYTSSYYTFTFATEALTVRTNGVADATYVENLGGGAYRIGVTWTATTVTGATIHILWNDGTSGVALHARRPQLEAGSTPSSYIPTSGSTVTRAAETLTIPSENLPWPSPVYVTNEELVTNGTFDSDTSGWSATNSSHTKAVSEGNLRITASEDNNYGVEYQGITTEIGKVYRASMLVAGGTCAGRMLIGNSFGSGGIHISTYYEVNPTVVEYDFVATATTTYIQAQLVGGVTGEYCDFDNISVKEINPLALSIQMSGEMTYADTNTAISFDGQTGEVAFFSHRVDSSNYIAALMSTTSTETGKLLFFQEANGAWDVSQTSTDYFSPGINVPFNIASRHGSTFINGAVDGVALTEDTSPVALPDLSSTDLQLGYDFMGTIDTFRVWAEDIADTGIAEATEPSEEATLFLSFDGNQTSYISFDWSE